ncbi:MAG: DUF1638 domain-containing protein [Deltaproteobacteria bacterium]|nr:DUF1638 domain-containing protein [Deltaproteobacteria bacterium]
MENNKVIIACEALKKRLTQALQKIGHKGEVRFLDAALHLRPRLLHQRISQEVTRTEKGGGKSMLLFGNCIVDMKSLSESLRVPYTGCENCYHMFLGNRYQELLNQESGTYFLERYLCENFHRLVIEALKFDQHPQIKDLMFKHYRRAVYIDYEGAGLTEAARQVADYLGLPLELETADPAVFAEVLVKMGLRGEA